MKLYLLNADKSVESEFELFPPLTRIGREVDNDLNLLVPGVSRYHCEVEVGDSGWVIRDLGSTNGTSVNGENIQDARVLRPGDVIYIGEQLCRFGESSPSAETVISAAPSNLSELAGEVVGAEAEMPDSGGIPVFDSTETVKNSKTQFSVAPEMSPQIPKVIINLPGNELADGGSIVFEPIHEEVREARDMSRTELSVSDPVPPRETPDPKPSAEKKLELKPSPSDSLMASSPPEPGGAGKTMVVSTEAPKLSGDLLGGDIFGKSLHGREGKRQAAGGGGEPKKRRFSDLLFYTVVASCAVIAISLFISFQKKPEKRAAAAPVAEDKGRGLVVVYERKIISRDGVFRFHMSLEHGKVRFSLDDLSSGRHYIKEDPQVREDLLAGLNRDIRETSFMELPRQPEGAASEGRDESRVLTIAYDRKLKTVEVRNNAAPASFEDIERGINSFAEEYGLHTIAMTPEELLKQANAAFDKAEELFLNRDANPANLKQALIRYQTTIDYLDQFAPKPEKWQRARKRLAEAREILKKRIDDLNFDYNRYVQLKEFEKALEVTSQLMPLLEPDSKDYKKFRGYRLKLEEILRRNKKK